ncbi:MAG: CHAP domain-containing protein [Candidatus Saccharibacteria bacterium]
MKKIINKKNYKKCAYCLVLAVLFLVSYFIANFNISGNSVYADQFDEQIIALERESAAYMAQAEQLALKADSINNAVAELETQVGVIQSQINISQVKYDQLVFQIAETEKKISDNRDALGVTIANLYVEDNVSPVEILFGSKNISDYMDKQEYRNSVRNELSATITKIKELKVQLDAEKLNLESILTNQKNQYQALEAKRAEQQKLLDDTRGDEAVYTQLAQASRAKKEEVQRQQQAAIQAALRKNGRNGGILLPGDPSNGGYPAEYANLNYYDYVPDQWGMYARQCVSYVAWKVYQKNGYMPYWGGRGNANQWDDNARNSVPEIPTGPTPRVNSAGVLNSGSVGHIVWVEAVNSDGTIDVSQYNLDYGYGPGMYSRQRVPADAYDVYIYF